MKNFWSQGRGTELRCDAMLAFVRKDANGKLVYLFALGKQQNEMTFDNHGQAFDFACEHRIDFVHQPWSPEIEHRIHVALGL